MINVNDYVIKQLKVKDLNYIKQNLHYATQLVSLVAKPTELGISKLETAQEHLVEAKRVLDNSIF